MNYEKAIILAEAIMNSFATTKFIRGTLKLNDVLSNEPIYITYSEEISLN